MNYKINHFVTVGTSIARNFYTVLGRCHDNPSDCPLGIEYGEIIEYLKTLDKCLWIPPGSPGEIECINSLSGWSRLHDYIIKALEWDHKRMSAELNAMDAWIRYAEERNPAYMSRVYLYVTESGTGILSGKILEEYLKRRLPQTTVVTRIITGMRENIWRALRNLASELGKDVSDVIRRDSSEKEIVLLNLTGGLKPEGAVALLEVARRLRNNGIAYYIHEIHKKPTPIPIIITERQITEAKNLILPRLGASDSNTIEIPVNELTDYSRWLLYFAIAVEPLDLAKVKDQKLYLNTELARMIVY